VKYPVPFLACDWLRQDRTSLSNSGVEGALLPTSSTPSVDPATNRIDQSGFVYDAAGNLKQEATKSYDYDAENWQTRFNNGAVIYTYDGDGHRVKKVAPGNPTVTTVFVYDVLGHLIAEYISGTPSGGGTSYLTTDHLGSTRVVTKQDGSVKARYDYLPFGEEIGTNIGGRGSVFGYGGTDSTRQKFTQKERDSESGLDYFGARYYSAAQGRFTSPDYYSRTHISDHQSRLLLRNGQPEQHEPRCRRDDPHPRSALAVVSLAPGRLFPPIPLISSGV
jgi:RHS repeat-associated protein